MGRQRNGARSFLDLVAQVCKLSRLPGFQVGLIQILGPTEANAVTSVWEPFCAVVDGLIAGDNWYNKKDLEDTSVGDFGEDIALS
jgi:hypothetical protein